MHPPPPPQSLRVQIVTPRGDWELKTLEVRGASCGAVLDEVKRQFRIPVGQSHMMISVEMSYMRNGEERKAAGCFHEGNYQYFDLQDRQFAQRESRLLYFRRFLLPSSPLPFVPGRTPYIFIRTDVEFLAGTPRGELLGAPASALTDPVSSVLLRGVRSGGRLFWEVDGFWFVDSDSGEVFNLKEIPGEQKHFFFAFFKNKDRTPRIRVPKGEILFILRRAGLQLRMQDGCVVCDTSSRATHGELWSFPKNVHDFDRNFTNAARRN